jgi:hypothetical protein
MNNEDKETQIKELERQRLFLAHKDRWNDRDHDTDYELRELIRKLKQS